MLMSGLLFPADESMVMFGGARARFVLRALVDSVFGVRFPEAGVPGVFEIWFRRWSMSASCCALIASASTSCLRESGSVVARGGSPGERMARPMFFVAVGNNMGAGLRRSCGDVDMECGGGDSGSSLTLL
jgi:hypothetical protein